MTTSFDNFMLIIIHSVPELLVLNDCDIDRAGESEDLKKKVYPVKELDLAQNKLSNWQEVFCILSHMPRVEFVNLSLNRLMGPVSAPLNHGMSKLRSLVLNNTRLEWESVESLLSLLPVLEELHLSLNDYHNVLIDTDDDFLVMDNDSMLEELEIVEDDENDNEKVSCSCGVGTTTSLLANDYKRTDSTCSNYKKTNPHNGVSMLHFTGNPVTDWSEICRLGRVFPNLKSLVLAECPIKSVDEIQKPANKFDALTAPNSAGDDDKVNTGDERDPPHVYFQ